jgi:hypothetical protein
MGCNPGSGFHTREATNRLTVTVAPYTYIKRYVRNGPRTVGMLDFNSAGSVGRAPLWLESGIHRRRTRQDELASRDREACPIQAAVTSAVQPWFLWRCYCSSAVPKTWLTGDS